MTYRPCLERPEYLAGDDGSIWSIISGTPKKRKLSLIPNGRLYVIIVIGKRVKFQQVARMVLGAFHGPCPPGLECCHNDGNPLNNRPGNLRWDTHASNMKDCERHNSFDRIRGERNHKAVLTNAIVKQIVQLDAGGVRQAEIARRLGIRPKRVCAVLGGRVWSHVSGIPKKPYSRRKP